ncbi:MAG: GNAT family N-acetyltransferase [Cyanobacteria bacterium P01_F01_bin.86]
MYIRQAAHNDIDTLVSLGRRTFLDAFAADNDPADMERYLAEAFSPLQIQSELSNTASIFLLVYPNPDAQPTGYARLLGNSSEPCVTSKYPIQLVRLYVDKSAIGQGYGAKLMQTCLEYAGQKRFDTIWLSVWEKNYRAQSFYQSWGFQKVGTLKFLLGKDQQTDLILMRPIRTDATFS